MRYHTLNILQWLVDKAEDVRAACNIDDRFLEKHPSTFSRSMHKNDKPRAMTSSTPSCCPQGVHSPSPTRASTCALYQHCFRASSKVVRTRPQSACHCSSRTLTSIFVHRCKGLTYVPHTHLLLSPATKSNRSAPFAPGDETGVDTKRKESGTRLKFGVPSILLQQCVSITVTE